ncbi:hypothetical protein [Nocardia sp. NPDC006630]|uniref:hypothetical protein n=1 Tax=Nocardia sp. NPDC006630 TaxID=3157181 RepID=UPI00339FE06B
MKRKIIGRVFAVAAVGALFAAPLAGTASADTAVPMHQQPPCMSGCNPGSPPEWGGNDHPDFHDPRAPRGDYDWHCDRQGNWHNDEHDQWGHPDADHCRDRW